MELVHRSLVIRFFPFLILLWPSNCCDALLSIKGSPKVYRYFAFGSNLLPTTMTALRGIQPLNASAAILPNYELRFDGNPKSRLEPSAAFVQRAEGSCVHGVVYNLSAADFAKVGNTEGVPFLYRWNECQVIPYRGDGESAGATALVSGTNPLSAHTLVPPKQILGVDVPPSRSYLNIIREGAKYWKLDRIYQEKIDGVQVAENLLVPDGLSGLLLESAKFLRGTKI